MRGCSGAAPLPPGFVVVHAGVGDRQQRFVRSAVLREHRGPDADTQLDALAGARLEKYFVDAFLELLPLLFRFVSAAPRQHHDELVARIADADVVRSDGRPQHAGDLAERTVADVMSVAVVDLLELVE